MAKLTDADIEEALRELPGWTYDGNRITKEFAFQTFMEAIAFINRIAEASEAADHHPDLENHYTRVLVSFRSWDADGVTNRDLRMAGATEEAASA